MVNQQWLFPTFSLGKIIYNLIQIPITIISLNKKEISALAPTKVCRSLPNYIIM